MKQPQEIINGIYRQFYKEAEAAGIVFSRYDEETGVFYIPTSGGTMAEVRLDNLIDYYWKTRDENAVSDFVRKIKDAVTESEDPSWEEARDNIYISPANNENLADNPYSTPVTAYFSKIYVVDTPDASIRIYPHLAAKWGVTEDDIEKQALANGARLLESVDVEVGDVDGKGHMLGSFAVPDRNLTGACLFAPGMKEKVSALVGWPIYVVFPNKISCYFLGADHFGFFEENIGRLVVDMYSDGRPITPELLEFSDDGIKPLCSWMQGPGSIIKLPGEPAQ